jgi:hypothetical protein
MIKLETSFVSGDGGFASDPLTYTQVARTAGVAIYERSRNGKTYDFEVFRIKILAKGTKIFDAITEDDQEKYPSTSQFGIVAWSFNNRKVAMKRYQELSKEAQDKADGVVEVKKELLIPVTEFTVGEFAEANGMTYANAFLFVKGALGENKIKFLREERRNAKGKPSKIYAKA